MAFSRANLAMMETRSAPGFSSSGSRSSVFFSRSQSKKFSGRLTLPVTHGMSYKGGQKGILYLVLSQGLEDSPTNE